jgi:hypothetical protein
MSDPMTPCIKPVKEICGGEHCHLDHHGRGEYDLDLEKKKKRSIINND